MSEALLISLSDIADINPPRKTLQLADTDEVSFIPMSDVTDNARWLGNQTRLLREVRSGYTYFEEGDVLFAKITPCTENGKGCLAVGLKNGIGFGSTEFHVLRAKPNSDPRFIFQWTIAASLRSQAAAQMIGSAGQQRVPEDFLSRFQIPALRRSEQTAIADILATVDRAIGQSEALIAKQRRIKAGLLHDLLTRGIDEKGNLRHPSTHRFKASPVGPVPEEWEVRALSQVANVDRGQFKHRPRNEPSFYGGTFPFIQTGDVTDNIGRVFWTFSQTLSKKGTTVSKEFPDGTIAVTIAANIADTAILGIPMYFPDSIVGVVPWEKQTTRFIEMCIRDRKRIFDSLAPQSAQKNINLQDLRPMLIPWPDPEEQSVIGEVFETFDLQMMLNESTLSKLHRLKTGLMQDLLSGRVSVAGVIESTSRPG